MGNVRRVTLVRDAGQIEDSRLAAKAVVQTFEAEGWKVVEVETLRGPHPWIVTCTADAPFGEEK